MKKLPLLYALFTFLFLTAFGQAPLKHTDNSNWLIDIADSVSIGDINLPGSHDAAAINPKGSTPYACHSNTIPEQLESGIRLLDIRLKVKGDSPNYTFATCHGDVFGGTWGFNEYQSFTSVLDECKDFLTRHPSEFIVMTLKIDDWNKSDDKENVYSALLSEISKYPIYNTADSNLPMLGNVRGKIYLINRINSTNEFGVPLAVPDKKSEMVPAVSALRAYPIYVQDVYEDMASPAEETKLTLVENAIAIKRSGDRLVVLNFASGRQGFLNLNKVYIQDKLLAYFGSMDVANRPAKLGWILFDYDNWQFKTDIYGNVDIVKVIISSNFGYNKYPAKFKVLPEKHE
ncbi:MAG TPA: phosphatidylinositol-specific phospholipase C domain-containing protein [Bacteroidia bacterium]|nr:phosphatidylinositol-specific phospholipase C domain-containing protein [Bacteroidia bacterium]